MPLTSLDCLMIIDDDQFVNTFNMSMSPIAIVTRVDQVRRAILSQIFSGALKPGDRLVEARLASELGVSQATVNAALQDMHNQGIVNKMLNRFTEVSRYTWRELENLFSVRMILEPAAAEMAARTLTPEGVRRLTTQVDQMRAAARLNDIPLFCLADYTFHQETYALSCNSFLVQACQAIAAAPFAYILCGSADPLPADYLALAEDHQEIVTALQKGPEAAGRLLRERIEAWRAHSEHALSAAALTPPG
ncbi:MAG: transcriptional regulator, GntR family [Bryobacterales bacterium]|nr:transcriptional regulator, GntR family [Bryobacterales bacterium]